MDQTHATAAKVDRLAPMLVGINGTAAISDALRTYNGVAVVRETGGSS